MRRTAGCDIDDMPRATAAWLALWALAFVGACTGGVPDDDAGVLVDGGVEPGPFIARVVSYALGAGAGHGEDALPGIVMGPPDGYGDAAGSVDVLSLGRGGHVVVELGQDVVDGEGADFVVFENAFEYGTGLFTEPGEVAVSLDGDAFETFPCDPETGTGCAGQRPVYAASGNDIDPLGPDAGGDRFDLAEVGLDRARFIRVTDVGDAPIPPDTTNNGFDLDAAAALHR